MEICLGSSLNQQVRIILSRLSFLLIGVNNGGRYSNVFLIKNALVDVIRVATGFHKN